MSSPEPRAVVVLISGRGSNMQAIAACAARGGSGLRVAAVLSDREAAAGLAVASELGIPTHVVRPRDHRDREASDAALAAIIDDYAPAVIACAGYMRILCAAFVRRFSGRLLNIHPSLLPAYRGLETHRRVLEAGERAHGASVHFVTEELDAGPLIVQGRIPVRAADTVASLSARIQAVEHRIYPLAVGLVAAGRVRLHDGAAYLDDERLAAPLPADFEETV
jgi:phosphoribosylglycinamide formyltransferase-1